MKGRRTFHATDVFTQRSPPEDTQSAACDPSDMQAAEAAQAAQGTRLPATCSKLLRVQCGRGWATGVAKR